MRLVARTRLDQAGAVADALGDLERAARRFAEAIALLHAGQAGGPAAPANSLQPRRRRAPVHCGHVTDPQVQLTARERAILGLLAESLTAESIARRLNISAGTVHKHLASLYRKLGTHDRLATVLRAQHLGLLAELPGRR